MILLQMVVKWPDIGAHATACLWCPRCAGPVLFDGESSGEFEAHSARWDVQSDVPLQRSLEDGATLVLRCTYTTHFGVQHEQSGQGEQGAQGAQEGQGAQGGQTGAESCSEDVVVTLFCMVRRLPAYQLDELDYDFSRSKFLVDFSGETAVWVSPESISIPHPAIYILSSFWSN